MAFAIFSSALGLSGCATLVEGSPLRLSRPDSLHLLDVARSFLGSGGSCEEAALVKIKDISSGHGDELLCCSAATR